MTKAEWTFAYMRVEYFYNVFTYIHVPLIRDDLGMQNILAQHDMLNVGAMCPVFFKGC